MSASYTLYGMEASLYTARARSYMRVNAVPFKEVKAGSKEFAEDVVPKIGRWIIPVLKTPGGELIQDSVEIIEHLDQQGFSKAEIFPSSQLLRIIAHVFEIYGCHGLLRPAMHYRWNFDGVNLDFIRDMFRDGLPDGLSPEQREEAFLHASGRMRKVTYLSGISDETQSIVEQSYHEFLTLLNDHLEIYPFLLGGHPTIADYGLIGAMYAHLGRDPYPLHTMQKEAPRVFRWVERMNMAETFEDESFLSSGGHLIDDDDLPTSLLDLLRFISKDYLPEIVGHVKHANEWLAANPAIKKGTSVVDEAMRRGMGRAAFEWHGADISSFVIPYRFFLLDRLRNSFKDADQRFQPSIRQLFEEVGLGAMLDLKTDRIVCRINNLEVWGDHQ